MEPISARRLLLSDLDLGVVTVRPVPVGRRRELLERLKTLQDACGVGPPTGGPVPGLLRDRPVDRQAPTPGLVDLATRGIVLWGRRPRSGIVLRVPEPERIPPGKPSAWWATGPSNSWPLPALRVARWRSRCAISCSGQGGHRPLDGLARSCRGDTGSAGRNGRICWIRRCGTALRPRWSRRPAPGLPFSPVPARAIFPLPDLQVYRRALIAWFDSIPSSLCAPGESAETPFPARARPPAGSFAHLWRPLRPRRRGGRERLGPRQAPPALAPGRLRRNPGRATTGRVDSILALDARASGACMGVGSSGTHFLRRVAPGDALASSAVLWPRERAHGTASAICSGSRARAGREGEGSRRAGAPGADLHDRRPRLRPGRVAFVSSRSWRSRALPVRSVLGYSSAAIPTILSGVLPDAHGHFSMYRRAGGDGVFRALGPALSLASRVTAAAGGFVPVTRYLHWRGVTGYFSLYDIPLPHLTEFDLCQRRDIYAPGAFEGGLTGLRSDRRNGPYLDLAGSGGRRPWRTRNRTGAG